MPPRQSAADPQLALFEPVAPIRFDVAHLPAQEQLLAWRDRVGHVIDVVPSRAQMENPFRAHFDRFAVGEFIFNDGYSDGVALERTIARVSQDNARGIIFHIFLSGIASGVVAHSSRRQSAPSEIGILAVDMDQPLYAARRSSRHITFITPIQYVTPVFPDPGMLHRRVLDARLPAVGLIIRRVIALLATIRAMPSAGSVRHLKSLLTLILAAFGEQAGLIGGKRALARAAIYEQVRLFVRLHLADRDLSAESVIGALRLARPTVYRLFHHEGGLATFIQNERLRAAAAELLRYPGIPVKDVVNAFGFSSAPVFSRAFRRAYDMSPRALQTVGKPKVLFDHADWID